MRKILCQIATLLWSSLERKIIQQFLHFDV